MADGEKPKLGPAEAKRLLDAGWRQAIAFRAPAQFSVPIPFDRDNEWLVVCTQTCSVVSERFTVDPFIEVVAAKPISKYNPRSPEATGKNARQFSLPLVGGEAVQCDINRRCFIDREMFLGIEPDLSIQVLAAAKGFAGWISRYYTRVAWPNALVDRAKAPGGLYESVKAALAHPFGDKGPLSDWVSAIYVNWKPDDELSEAQGAYQVSMRFLCDNLEADTALGALLCEALDRFEAGHDGITLQWDVKAKRTTFVTDLDGYYRLSEWDYLTDLGRVGSETDTLPPTQS
jgi:hypothetical protein